MTAYRRKRHSGKTRGKGDRVAVDASAVVATNALEYVPCTVGLCWAACLSMALASRSQNVGTCEVAGICRPGAPDSCENGATADDITSFFPLLGLTGSPHGQVKADVIDAEAK